MFNISNVINICKFVLYEKLINMRALPEGAACQLTSCPSRQLTITIFAPTIFRPTCMFTDEEDSGRGITTRKFSRGISKNTTKHKEVNYSWSTRVWDDWLKNATPYHDSDKTATLSWNRRIWRKTNAAQFNSSNIFNKHLLIFFFMKS